MPEYRLTRNMPYHNCKGPARTDLSARQGFYIVADTPEFALAQMRANFETDWAGAPPDVAFTVQTRQEVDEANAFAAGERRMKESLRKRLEGTKNALAPLEPLERPADLPLGILDQAGEASEAEKAAADIATYERGLARHVLVLENLARDWVIERSSQRYLRHCVFTRLNPTRSASKRVCVTFDYELEGVPPRVRVHTYDLTEGDFGPAADLFQWLNKTTANFADDAIALYLKQETAR